MKKALILPIAAALALAACSPKAGKKAATDFRKNAPTAGPARKIQLGNFETFKLPNGLTVITVEDHKLPKVSWNLTLDNDPVLEKEAAGLGGLFGDLMARGTSSRTKAQFDEEVDFIGATVNPRANGLYAESLTRHTDKLLELAADVLLNPAFPPDEFEKIKAEALSGLASEKDNADAIARKVAARLRNGPAHPYGEVTTEATVGKASVELCKNFYATYFRPNVAYLTVTGDITRAEAERLAKKYFGAWKAADVPRHTYAVPQPGSAATVDFIDKPGAVQSVINITHPIEMHPGSPDQIKASVMNNLLGGFFNSYLMQNLREKHAYTYGARSSLNADPVVGSFTAFASVRNAVTDSAIIQFQKELNRIRTEPPTAEALEQSKSVMAGNFSRSLEDPGTVARFALNTIRYKLPTDYYSTYLEKLAAVGPADITAVAQKYVLPGRAHILVVGNQEQVADRLKPFAGEGGKVNFYDVYGEEIKPVDQSLPPGTTTESVIADYLAAIGGAGKLSMVIDLEQTGSTAMMGMDIAYHVVQKKPGKILFEMTAGGRALQKQVCDGTRGQASGMGGSEPIEGDELENLKVEALPFAQLDYAALGHKLTLKGVEEVNGRKAYRIDVLTKTGRRSSEFYDMETSLKVRETTTEGDGTEARTITTDFSDYQEESGVKTPRTVVITGAAPVPMKISIASMKVNQGVKDEVFMVK